MSQPVICRTGPDGESCSFAGYKQAGRSVGKTGADIKRACREKKRCYGYWWQDNDRAVPGLDSRPPRYTRSPAPLSLIMSSLASVSSLSIACLLGADAGVA